LEKEGNIQIPIRTFLASLPYLGKIKVDLQDDLAMCLYAYPFTLTLTTFESLNQPL
jgi:hypothetical protein